MAAGLGSAAALLSGCRNDDNAEAFDAGVVHPDELPQIVSNPLPIRYPPALYAEKIQGNVRLRLFVDTAGGVVNDSTRVVESSTVAMLDSAAVRGARELKFVPATTRGKPVAVSIIFPVYFRHPEAPPLEGDSTFQKVPLPDSAELDSAKKS